MYRANGSVISLLLLFLMIPTQTWEGMGFVSEFANNLSGHWWKWFSVANDNIIFLHSLNLAAVPRIMTRAIHGATRCLLRARP